MRNRSIAATARGSSRHLLAGVPVICHVGLVPPKATWTGGFKAVGKTLEQAKMIWTQVQEFENVGSFAGEIEVVAAGLATEITKRTSMLTISRGSGGGCDAQYMFSADLLGENRGHIPRHAKTYRNFAAERDRLQDERVAAYSEYIADVMNGGFPDADQVVNVDDDTLAKVWETQTQMLQSGHSFAAQHFEVWALRCSAFY